MNDCPECDSAIRGGKCDRCGWKASKEKLTQSNGLPWWKSPPPYVKPKDTDICGEWMEEVQGFCQKTVGEHRREFLEFGKKLASRVIRL